MSDSLLIAAIETLGGASQSTYKISTGGLQFGAPEPDQATIASLLLDGDVVTGLRSKNRTMTLSITVFTTAATSQLVRSALTAACDALLTAVNAATFTMQWTPDGGLPVIWDCYRARGQRDRSIVRDNQGVTMIALSFQAAPFGRSPIAETIAAPAALQIDSFDTAPTGATLDTTTKYEGTGSAQVTLNWNGTAYTNTTPVTRSYAAKDLSAYSSLALAVLPLLAGAGGVDVTITLTLASTGGSSAYTATVGATGSGWRLAGFTLSNGTVVTGTGVNLAAVTSESFTFTTGGYNGSSTRNVHIDDLRATGSSYALASTTHAEVVSVPVAVGSARAPMNLALTNSGTFGQFVLHSPPSDQDPAAQILTQLSSSLADQTVTIPAAKAGFDGTYMLMLASPLGGGTNDITVTVTQLENGVAVGSGKVLDVTYDYTGGNYLIPMGNVTLPLYDIPADNTQTTYTVRVQTTSTARFTELMLLDTRGQTIYTDGVPPVAVAAVYVDEPAPLQSAPSVYGGAARASASSIVWYTWITGGPIIFEPGVNKILAWVESGTPAVSATYYPRWLDERVA